MSKDQLDTLEKFYPFYLSQHSNRINRKLHFIGTLGVILLAIHLILFNSYINLYFIPFVGYGFAWVGHFFFEKNKPATFKYPVKSFLCDFIMFKRTLTSEIESDYEQFRIIQF